MRMSNADTASEAGHNTGRAPSHRPRLALLADVRGWAFSNIAVQISQNLKHRYDIDIYYRGDYGNDISGLYRQLFVENDFDLVHCFWRTNVIELADYAESAASGGTTPMSRFTGIPVTFSIYDHLFLSPADIAQRRRLFNELIGGYTVSSKKLFDIYSRIEEYPPPDMIIEDGIDPRYFYPKDTARLGRRAGEIIIGWVGNSTWYQHEGIDHKGFHTLIKPALCELQAEGLPLRGSFVDRNEGYVPFEKMVDYYNSIDIYICASDIEGTPNPVLEAMACGVPVISTDVGIVPEVFGPLQSAFILQERSVPALKEKIRELALSPETRLRLSGENLERIRPRTREAESRNWDAFFSLVLNRRQSNTASSAAATGPRPKPQGTRWKNWLRSLGFGCLCCVPPAALQASLGPGARLCMTEYRSQA